MKIYELMQTQTAKITKVMPNQSAEVDNGDGTKTVIDLKKNPSALTKDPESGKVKLATKQTQKPGQPAKKPDSFKPGDQVEIEQE